MALNRPSGLKRPVGGLNRPTGLKRPLGGLNRPGTAFVPGNQAALPLWLDGFDINLLGNSGISNDDPIGTWKNKGASGAALDVTQAVAGNKPLFKASYINAHPALLFDAIDDVLAGTASPVALSAARHVFAVVVVPATFGGSRTYYCSRSTVGGGYSQVLANNTLLIESNFQDTSCQVGASPATGLKMIVEMSYDGVSTNLPTCVFNGVAQTVTQTAGVGVNLESAAAGMLIGNAYGEGVGEILVYNALQSAGVVAANRAGLSAKWGIAAP